jgi:hypothetical protein
MITEFKDYEELFEKLSEKSQIPINLNIIGGAALLFRKLKPATKDIDVVVQTKEEFEQVSQVLYSEGFVDFSPKVEGYENFAIGKMFKKENMQFDLFCKKVCGKFVYSTEMMKRSELILTINKLHIYLCANEDIFVFKSMTGREGDLSDCIALAKNGLNWDSIYAEILHQIDLSGQDVWITWINERCIELEERGVYIPFAKKLDKLAEEFLDKILENEGQ